MMMTTHRPEEHYVIPVWLAKWVGPLLVSVLGYLALTLIGATIRQNTQGVQIDTLQKEMAIVVAEQKLNTESRIQFREFMVQYPKDLSMIVEGHKVILAELREHEQQTRKGR